MKQQLIVSAKSFTETLFKFVDSPRGRARADHKQFIQDMNGTELAHTVLHDFFPSLRSG